MRRAVAAAALAAGFLALAAPAANRAEDGAGEPLRIETRDGPVTATVTLAPAAPRLGDRMVLELSVEAEPGVRVEMPTFGDALGRFTVFEFAPRAESAAGGGSLHTQRYTLQATRSGRHRIPGLRVEFVDERPGRGDGRPRELLTEELVFEVASVLPREMESMDLRPARRPLPELGGPWWERERWWLAVALAALAAGAAALAALRRRRSPQRIRASAYRRASARLERLRAQGLPKGTRVDPWYVELSDIVRRYVEERFALRAPELTTEEFLLEAGRSEALSPPHRGLLSDFLERCDRVKFARYRPPSDESREVLEVAARFLAESRAPEPATGASGGASADPLTDASADGGARPATAGMR